MLFALGRRVAAARSTVTALSRRGVFIQVEKTPNPSSLKFLPSQPVLTEQHRDGAGFHFHKGDREYLRSPLATKLLGVEHVTGVFFAADFVTVSKTEQGAWATLKPEVFSALMDFYAEGAPAVGDDVGSSSDTVITDDDSEVVAMIKELVEARIRPAVQEDGGDIFFRGFDEATGLVKVELAGACVGCPSSSITLRNGVENMLMHYIEEVKGIEEIVAETDGDDPFKLSFTPQDSPHLSI